ncbi:MAG: thioredoxin-disulfide reductase [Candidatus Micrarchaeota archaeon]
MDADQLYDVIIIGAGAAGLTAGMYCSRKRLKNAVISIDIGGQTNLTNHIENFPGVGALPGMELMERFHESAKKFGSEFVSGKVDRIEKAPDGTFFVTIAEGEKFHCKALILAFGAMPRLLGIPGEEKFLGRGVSTCTTCDAPFYKNKVAAVVGGGNSAVEGALELGGIASKVYLIHRRGEFRADAVTLEKLKAAKNIEVILNAIATEVLGDKKVSGIKIKLNSGETREVALDGVFIEIGYEVKTDFLKGLVDLNEKNEIVIDLTCKTSLQGIFAAGDITNIPYKQAIISAGEGAKAALSAYKYLTGGKGGEIDWT